jgi:anti-sigma factor RsiW
MTAPQSEHKREPQSKREREPQTGSRGARATWGALCVAALVFTACTGGVNAGEEGGVAFIVFAGMLILMVLVLWLALGRED